MSTMNRVGKLKRGRLDVRKEPNNVILGALQPATAIQSRVVGMRIENSERGETRNSSTSFGRMLTASHLIVSQSEKKKNKKVARESRLLVLGSTQKKLVLKSSNIY